MDKVIILCLLILVTILLYDRNKSKSNSYKAKTATDTNIKLPDIMGKPKSVPIHRDLNTNNVNQSKDCDEVNPEDLDIDYDENETLYRQIPNEELDKVFTKTPDLEEEEEEFYQQALSIENNTFAQGVSFEELSTVNSLLQKDFLDPEEKQTITDIAQRLQGTELVTLLENSIEGASQKIAQLLDNSLKDTIQKEISSLKKINTDDFDIGAFL